MAKKKLRAILRCGAHKPGAVFFESSTNAKALVALKRAKYVTTEQPIYSTRDMQAAPVTEPVAPLMQYPPEQAAQSDSFNISGSARILAEENGIDLSMVEGSGRNGRIIKADIESILENAE